MKKMILLSVALSTAFVSCDKNQQESIYNPEEDMDMVVFSDPSYNKKKQIITFTPPNGPSTTTIRCVEKGNDCRIVDGGIDILHKSSNITELRSAITNKTLTSFFQGNQWQALFPEFENTSILKKLQNGQLKMIELPQTDNLEKSMFVVCSADVNNNHPKPEQILLAIAF